MRLRLQFLGLILLLATACRQEGTTTPTPIASPCAELDSLFSTLKAMDSVLLEGTYWEECVGLLQTSLQQLSHNQRPENKDCNYLDQRILPDEPRLLFVETLRSRIEQDTLPAGIYYLLRYRGIFKEDPEISEFFSEELAHLAYSNPACYLGYLNQNPDQEVMLLYSTRWNTMDLDTLLARFGRLPAAEPVRNFLLNLKEQRSDGL
jgi:hypothetical protein